MIVRSKGMAFDPHEVVWKKSPQSGAVGNCVEIAHLSGDGVAVRDSEHPEEALLVFTGPQSGMLSRPEWLAVSLTDPSPDFPSFL